MTFIQTLGIIGSICSVVSLCISIFIATKVVKITANNSGVAKAEGDGNVVIGRDFND